MNGILVPVLYVCAGVCLCAALNHWVIAKYLSEKRTHRLFAMVCVGVALYIIAKAGAYRVDTAEALVEMRRLEFYLAVVPLVFLPWFVASYCGVRPTWVVAALNVATVSVGVGINYLLPYGVSFAALPSMRYFILPWGERILDVRVPESNAGHIATWLVILLVFAYCAYACIQQYRRGGHRRALTLALGLGLFVAFSLFNLAVNAGLVAFVHTAEFGFVALVAVMTRDLTLELRERERRTQQIIDNVPAIVSMTDLDGHCLLVNHRFQDLFGLASESVIGKSAFDILPAAQASALRAHNLEVIQTRRALKFEESVEQQGTVRSFESLRFPLLNSDGMPYAVAVVATDVTEILRAEREARALRQQVWHADRVARAGALSASLAHELNQPLTAVLSNAQAALRMLAGGKPDLQEIGDILEDIVQNDKRAAKVISSVRAMVRRQETERLPIDVAETAVEMLDLLRREFVTHRIAVTTEFEARPIVLADKGQIQQVLLNLVMNAVEAMRGCAADERRLHLGVTSNGDGIARIAVSDSGEGMAQGEIDRLFDPFHSTKPIGTGIGLVVCRSIIESHGGSIWLEPNHDRGVTALFTLALASSHPPASWEWRVEPRASLGLVVRHRLVDVFQSTTRLPSRR